MENSVSAPQYPQERAEHMNTKLHQRAKEPPRERSRLSRKAARVFGVESRGSSAVRLAMVAVRNTESELVAEKNNNNKNFKGNYFYNFAVQRTSALSLRYEAPEFPATQTIAAP